MGGWKDENGCTKHVAYLMNTKHRESLLRMAGHRPEDGGDIETRYIKPLDWQVVRDTVSVMSP